MSYYLAQSLVALRNEVNARWPRRDKTSDGWIGDASHSARKSSHNPDYANGGVVRGLDIDVDDNDPSSNLRSEVLKAAIGDSRVWYVISNGIIYSRTYNWAARRYTGSNPHTKHVHVSLREVRSAWTNTESWLAPEKTTWEWNPKVISDLPIIQRQFQIAAGHEKGELKRYHGVAAIQNALNVKNGERLPVNGLCDAKTVAAWKRWETKHPGTGRATTPDMDSLRKLTIAYRFKEPEQPAPKPPTKPTPAPTPVKVTFSVMGWNVENKGDADAALDRAEVIQLCAEEKPEYFCLTEVYRVDLRGIPGYQTYQAFDGYSANSENRAQAILVRNDVALKIKQALQMEEEWTGPKMGIEKEPRVHRYVTGNLHDLNIPVATMHVPFGKDAVEETRRAAIEWLKEMKAAHGRGVIVADWNSLADGLQAKVGTPAGATADGGGKDRAVFVGLKKVKGENLGNRGRSDHPVKKWTFEA